MSTTGRFILLLNLWIVSTTDLKPWLIYTNDLSIEKLELDTWVSSTLVRGLYGAVALDYHFYEGYIFWADQNADRITRMNISNPDDKVDIITNTVDQPVSIAVDWIYNHLYWVDAKYKHIMVSQTDGTLRKTLVKTDLYYPRAIIVHPTSGRLYFTDVKTVPKIETCGLDGSDRQTIISSGLSEPNGLSIDYTANRLYWIDNGLKQIKSAALDGSDVKMLTTFTERNMWAWGLTVFDNWIYWATYKNNTIYRIDKETGSTFEVVKTGLRSPMGIKIYSQHNQPSAGKTACLINNGGCEHLCLPSPTSSNMQCTCADGFILIEDGKGCKNTGSGDWLTYANMLTIERIDIDSNITETVYGRANNAVGLDCHVERGLVYWTDISNKKISRSSLTRDAVYGTSTDIITDMIETPYGIAIDWIYNLMYWTDTGMNHIQVSLLDGSYRRTVIKGGILDQPRAIVVDPSTGWLFFSNMGSQPRIEKCWMDGRDRQIIVKEDILRPNGMTIDYKDKRLYWIDGQLNHIKSTRFDGSDTNTVVQDKNILPNPFDLVVFNSYVYWSNWHHNSIGRIDKYTGKDFVIIADNLRSPMGLQMFGPTSQVTGVNVCGQNNGGCSHICFPSPESSDTSQSRTSECMCPDSFMLTNDKKTCIATDDLVTEDTEESTTDGLSSREITVYSAVSTVFVIIILTCVSIFFYRRRRKRPAAPQPKQDEELPPVKCNSTVTDNYDIINDDNRFSRVVQNGGSGDYLDPEYIDPCHTIKSTPGDDNYLYADPLQKEILTSANNETKLTKLN